MKNSMRFYILLGVINLTATATMAAVKCESLFNRAAKVQYKSSTELIEEQKEQVNVLKKASLEKQLLAGYSSRNVEAYAAYKGFLSKYPEIAANKKLNKAVMELLSDESLSSFHVILKSSLEKVTAPEGSSETVVIFRLKQKIYSEIVKFMSKADAKARVELLTKETATKEDMMQILGKMTAEESLTALVGKNGIRDLTEDSLIKRYLDAAAKKGMDVSTFLGQFKKGPRYKGQGEEKLYIPFDPKTAPLLEKVIGANPHLLMHNHSPQQGTLYMRYEGHSNSYASVGMTTSFRENPVGSILPVLTLSSIEASNVKNYFDLGSLEQKFAKYPWGFKQINKETKEKTEYCATGGYGSCTHWIGEMPIGENKVDKYSMPGQIGDDQYGHGHNEAVVEGDVKKLRTSDVGEYNAFVSRTDVERIGNTKRQHRLARMVWTQGLGHEQLWSVVGDKNAVGLSRGEWANPGWVLYNFLTRTTEQRVPVVFVKVLDIKAPFNQETLNELRSQIDPH